MTIILIIALIFYVIGAVVELIWQKNVEKKNDEIIRELIMLKARIGKLEDTERIGDAMKIIDKYMESEE